MKMTIVILFFLLLQLTSLLADYAITRGPDIGEIYFIGPTVTGEGIYHSTDFGETATCMDSSVDAWSICADLTPGSIYYFDTPECLYYSNNYGQQGSWVFRSNGMYIGLNSGRNEGEIYNAIASHSEDYGVSFIQHSYNGFFGNLKGSEIDNQDGVGYATTFISSVTDSIYLLISYDNFENFQIQKVLNYDQQNGFGITRGVLEAETFIIDSYFILFYSTDYCYTWLKNNEFNIEDFTTFGATGGRQEGEFYMMLNFERLMGAVKHTFIFHSIDYGITFDVYHPFSIGEEPLLANFSTLIQEGSSPLTVEFCNYSIGDIQTYEWDFDNDGVIDSYEVEPEYTFLDTGYYSIKLTIYDSVESNEFLRENYIHVTSNVGIGVQLTINNNQLSINNYPNPFNPSTTISFDLPTEISENRKLEIYNLKGQRIRQFSIFNGQSSITWDGTDNENKPVSTGIYLYKLNIQNSPIKKMILLK